MRYLTPFLKNDLCKKMVFLDGPHQSGKTTLSQYFLKTEKGHYFNWDLDEDRQDVLKKKWSRSDTLLIFDELHKYPKWKNWIKGIYDTQKLEHQFLITGSARLDVYRRGGDSLLGRYHHWRLHPFDLTERPAKMTHEECFKRLMTVGGFPEPFFDGDETSARRWRKERFDRIIKDDIRDLESIRNIQSLSLFVDLLRTRVGSPIVLSNMAEDLQVSQKTLKIWLEVLEKMYLLFVVRPYTAQVPRAIQKPPKVYFFDNADVIGDEGARFENLVATHLLKRNHFLEDSTGYRFELHYLRDKEGREIDFAITRDKKITSLIEVKLSDDTVSKSLTYYSERLKPEKSLQIVAHLKRPYSKGNLEVVCATSELSRPLVLDN